MRAKLKPVDRDPQLSFTCFVREEKNFPFEWHHHPEYELVLIEAGGGSRFIGDNITRYGPGDLVLLGPDLPQTWQSEDLGKAGVSRAVVIQFHPDSPVCLIIAKVPELAAVRRLLLRAKLGLHFPKTRSLQPVLEKLSAMPALPPVARLGALCEVLAALAERPAQAISSGPVTVLGADAAGTLDRVLRHVQAHVADDLQLSAVARLAGMGTPAFCRFFKRATGRTFTDHVNELRLGKAAHLLVETRIPVADISAQVGYANPSYFHRRFRAKYGLSALKYRKKYRG